jgi:tocopherol O-methyltransferase
MIVPNEPQNAAAVADHYDELDPFYRQIWGDHVHHGYWARGDETPEEAVEALVDLLAERLALKPGQHLCDIGCGYGATAWSLARRHGVRVTGVTISPVQAAHAQTPGGSESPASGPRGEAPGVDGVAVACQDWLANTFPDATFDRAYAIESSEHMVDKERFFAEAHRTLRPGGRLGVYAWLAREGARPWEIRHLLEPICREGRLPGMGTQEEYRDLAQRAGFRDIGFEDLSRQVRRTWTICARRVATRFVTDRATRAFLLDRRSRNRDFAWSLARLILAYRTGSMRYGLLTADKP